MSADIYVASSWRNEHQPRVVRILNEMHESLQVYDFRQPTPYAGGFAWDEIDPEWPHWSTGKFREGLSHPIAQRGFAHDWCALSECSACVLVLPCGRSAHLEAGFCIGREIPTCIYIPHDTTVEPELMYAMANTIVSTEKDLIAWVSNAFIL